MKLINIKHSLIKSAAICSCFFLLSGFALRSADSDITADTIVNIFQENGGLTVSVKATKNICVHFFMFTVEGRLIKELNIYGSKKINITELEKGIYIYDFFTNDERLKNGKIELR